MTLPITTPTTIIPPLGREPQTLAEIGQEMVRLLRGR
jgi:hypothetical protein